MLPQMGYNSFTALKLYFSISWTTNQVKTLAKGSTSFSQVKHLKSKTLPGFLKSDAFSHCQLRTGKVHPSQLIPRRRETPEKNTKKIASMLKRLNLVYYTKHVQPLFKTSQHISSPNNYFHSVIGYTFKTTNFEIDPLPVPKIHPSGVPRLLYTVIKQLSVMMDE